MSAVSTNELVATSAPLPCPRGLTGMKEIKNRECDTQCLLINPLVALCKLLAGKELSEEHMEEPLAVQAV